MAIVTSARTWIGVSGLSSPAIAHAGQPVDQRLLPAREPVDERGAGRFVAFGQLADEGADRAPADGGALLLKRDEGIEPAVDRREAVELVEQAVLRAEDRVGRDVDDRSQQVVAVVEVVVELAAAHVGLALDVLEADRAGAALGDQPRRRPEDPQAGRSALLGRR